MKVLLVEDNERVTRFVTRGLREAGHTVDHADNGRDGLFLAASEPYDVIVMDRMLPGQIDGLAIIEALRKSGNRVPILILSQLLTLFTTPVVYLYLDRVNIWLESRRGAADMALKPAE